MTLVLDSEALSALARSRSTRADPGDVAAAVRVALDQDREVLVAASVLSELYRGGSHDQVIDSCLSRFSAIVVVPTDQSLAREIGHVLARAGRGSADHVDAAVVAVAARSGNAVIATSDVDDMRALATGVQGVRIEAV